ncbi:MAG: hypothetical protein ACYDC1_15090 [Limisphaerales bacterium]
MKSPAQSAPKSKPPGLPTWMIVAAFVGVTLVAGLLVWPWPRDSSTPASRPAPETESSGSTSALPVKPEFEKLKGKWMRTDGGYVIEVTAVDGAGKLEAGYFNPGRIHVAKAEATLADGAVQVFVELRDAGYPGSTYTLRHVTESDKLVGEYYQATRQQRFEVEFARMP